MTLSKSVAKRLKLQSNGAPTFREQAETFLKESANRKRNPLRENSLSTYRSQISKNLNPIIGDMPLDVIGNAVVKSLIQSLVEGKLNSATIQLNFGLIKQIRESAVNQEGEPLYPYKYNTDFIDLPSVDEPKRPLVSAQAVEAAISNNCLSVGSLVAVLAGTGLRISEALALVKVDAETVFQPFHNYWFPEELKIVVKGQRGQTGGFGPTKTKAGEREVDIHRELNDYMKSQFLEKSLLFPLTDDAYLDKLNKCGILGGFHSLRRFRTTRLNLMSAPTGMEYFWMGHAVKDVHGRYVNVGEEIEKRKTEAERIGLGFKLERGNDEKQTERQVVEPNQEASA